MESISLRITLLVLALTGLAYAQHESSSSEEKCRKMLDEALEDRNPDIRKQAVIAVSLAGTKEPFFSMLESKLVDKNFDVRLAAVTSLSDIEGDQATEALRKAVDDEVPEISFAAAKALWARNSPAGRDALLSVLEGDAKTSSNFFSKQKRDTLRLMHTPKGIFLFALMQGVGFAPVPGLGEGIASMQALLADPGVSGRATAALLLGKDRDDKITAALKDSLDDKDWSVRAAAVHSLALRNDPKLTNDLLPLLEDKKEAVRLRAAAAYLRLQALHENSAAGAATPQ